MPAAAVIPAPIAYIKVVAVKKLVVGDRAQGSLLTWSYLRSMIFHDTLRKTECSKCALAQMSQHGISTMTRWATSAHRVMLKGSSRGCPN